MMEIPYGFCHCGCGQRTRIVAKANTRLGHVKGEPFRYIVQHHARLTSAAYLIQDRGYRTPCWVWQRYTDKLSGYGVVMLGGKQRKAHRLYWEQANGPVPLGLELDHLCRVRACVNPAHLEAVTHSVNVKRGYAARKALQQLRPRDGEQVAGAQN